MFCLLALDHAGPQDTQMDHPVVVGMPRRCTTRTLNLLLHCV
jgi:hypothetical protein